MNSASQSVPGYWIERLADEVGLASGRGYTVPWSRAEAEVGFRLPSDYKRFVEYFGPSGFDGFVEIYVPGVQNPHIELSVQAEECFDTQRYLASSESFAWTYAQPGEAGSLLCWATDSDGNFYCWKMIGGSDEWSVVVQPARGDDFFEYDGSMSEFLFRYLVGEIQDCFLPPPESRPITLEPLDGTWQGDDGLEGYGSFTDN